MDKKLSRRQILRGGLFGLATLSAGGLWLRSDAQVTSDSGKEKPPGGGDSILTKEKLTPTATNVEGPFYEKGAPFRAKISPPLARGKTLVIRGRVWGVDTRRPLPGSLIDIWQADHQGSYDNQVDSSKPSTYHYRARLVTDDQGYYEYETILPGRYPLGGDPRPRHIHYRIEKKGYRTLTTQLYFKGDPFNDTDALVKPSLIIDLKKKPVGKKHYLQGDFDIVLAPK